VEEREASPFTGADRNLLSIFTLEGRLWCHAGGDTTRHSRVGRTRLGIGSAISNATSPSSSPTRLPRLLPGYSVTTRLPEHRKTRDSDSPSRRKFSRYTTVGRGREGQNQNRRESKRSKLPRQLTAKRKEARRYHPMRLPHRWQLSSRDCRRP
jgi:hypothetical protein